MNVRQNISLKPYNTFGIDVPAEYFTTVGSVDELLEVASFPYSKHVLGGGSNILLTKAVSGLVVHNELKGITIDKEDDQNVWVRVQSGEVWHDFVLYAVNRGWGGIENLALIPGTVGASPMQNIGAYGVEAKETIESVTFWYWKGKTLLTYSGRDCNFGYRDSIFKHELKEKVFITSVVYKLSKRPVYNVSYGSIRQELEHMGVTDLSVKAIAYAVIHIRNSKLPDPKKIGNAGSFFKNPAIAGNQFEQIRLRYRDIPSYPAGDGMTKVPAAWLIEQCGWKGYKTGGTGVHAKHALVLVNYGDAVGNDVWELSERIINSVREKFGIELEREVQVW